MYLYKNKRLKYAISILGIVCFVNFNLFAAISSVDSIPVKETGDALTAEEVNALTGVLRGIFHEDNDTSEDKSDDLFGFGGVSAPTEFFDINGNVKATQFIGDGSQLTNIASLSQWDNIVGGLNYAGGNVGIGTVSPLGKFHVEGGDMVIRRAGAWVPLATDELTLGDGVGYWGMNAGADFYLSGNGVNKFTVLDSGNVGIGTTVPTQKLQIDDVDLPQLIIRDTTNNVQARMYASDTSGFIGTATTHPFRIQSDNVTRMFFDTVGNVGIGTNTPIQKLHIEDDNEPEVLLYDRTGMVQTRYQAGESAGYVGTASDHPFKIQANNSTKMTVLGDGNVGIGTMSPSEKLEVTGGDIQIRGDGASAYFKANDTTNGVSTWFGVSSVGRGLIGTMTNHGLGFKTNNVDRLLISSAGNVGIGTMIPSARLEVRQGMSDYATVFTDSHINLGTNTNENNTGFVGITYDASTSANYGWSSGALRKDLGQSNFVWKYHYSNEEGIERMRIDTSGNVGIGTMTPTQKLEVTGNVNATRYYVTEKTPFDDNELTSKDYVDSLVGGGTGDADTLDNLNSLQFLRSDESDTMTGNLMLNGELLGTQKISFDQGANHSIDAVAEGLMFDGGDGTNDLIIYDDQLYSDKLQLGYSGDATLGTYDLDEDLTIDPNGLGDVVIPDGNVGIGTTEPKTFLDIGGYTDNLAFSSVKAMISDDVNSVSGVMMSNVNVGGSADFRFMIKDTTDHYFAFAQPGVGNAFTLVGFPRKTTDYIFNAGGVSRNLVIATLSNMPLVFGTSGVQRMRIDSSGDVGIGTTTPSQKLEVSGIAQATRYFVTEKVPLTDEELTSKEYVDNLMDGDVGNADTLDTLDSLQFLRSDESDAMMGNLTLNGELLGTQKISFDQGANHSIDAVAEGLMFDGGDGTNDLIIYDDQLYSDKLQLGYSGDATLGTYDLDEDLTIDPNGVGNVVIPDGNVGIGTVSPSSKLHVNGDIRIGGAGSKIIRDTVKTFTLPALGTKMAVMNINDYSLCKVELYSSENSYAQPMELELNKVGSTMKPSIFKFGTYIDLHSSDVSFSSDASGNIWMEKKNYDTERLILMKKMEVHRGDCDFLDGTTTMAGTGTDMSVRVGVVEENDGKAYYTGDVGIGTMTPTQKLEVSGNAQATRYFVTEKVPLTDEELTSKEYVDNLIDGDADMLDGYLLSEIGFFQSDRDFINGTLVQTDIDSSVTEGDAWLLEIEGNSHGGAIPFDIKVQGYIFSDTIVNYGGISNGTNLSGLVVFNYNGNLCFWWPRQSYWQGFDIFVSNKKDEKVKRNRVVSITDVAKPAGVTKEVALSSSIRQSWYTTNDGTGSGLDADLLDGISSSSFLRSDEDDTMTGHLTLEKNIEIANTTHADESGIIYKNGVPFIHNFNYGNNGTVTTDGYNLFIGENAGNLTMGSTATEVYHGSYNIAVGRDSLYNNTIGDSNSAFGHDSLRSNTIGDSNSAFGHDSLRSNLTGNLNLAVGVSSLSNNTTGYGNSALGYYSLYFNSIGNSNSAVGVYSLSSNTTGSYNSVVGYNSLFSNTTGSHNLAVGYYAGRYTEDGSSNETGSQNIFIGYNTKALSDGDINEVVIGHNAIGLGSNTLVLGNDSITKTALKGNVGIGTITPAQKLEVTGIAQATRYYATEKVPLTDEELTSKEYVDNLMDGEVGNADTLDGYHLSEIGFFQSDRDFINGTLVQTDIDYSVTEGDIWLLEIEGNSYGAKIPFDIKIQGYIYSDTIINYGGISNGAILSGLVVFNYNGNLCFWWPYQSYWQGFDVFVSEIQDEKMKRNRVVSVADVAKPAGVTKEVALSSSIRQSWHTTNDGTGSGLDADLLDGIDSTSFLRSNESDIMTGNLMISGDVGIGTTTPGAKLEVSGLSTLITARNATEVVFKLENDGSVFADNGYSAPATDLAERMVVSESVIPGDVVVIDISKDETLKKSQNAYDSLVVGIVSTKPGLKLGDEGEYIALAGRVPVNVVGEVKRGDLLVTSSVSGKAMACDDIMKCAGAILGKALTNSEKGQVIAFVTLQ